MLKRKDTFIIVRVSSDTKKKLVELAGGARKLSNYVREVLTRSL